MEYRLPQAKHLTLLFLRGVAERRVVVVGLLVVGLRVVVIGGHLKNLKFFISQNPRKFSFFLSMDTVRLKYHELYL